MTIYHVIIIGGGISGIASALALTRLNKLSCSVYEIRPSPSTIGGAINLTPNALRYLDHLGVLPKLAPKGCEVHHIDVISQRTGRRLGIVDFENAAKFKHCALRVLRAELLKCLMEVLEEEGVMVQYGKKIEAVSQREDGIQAMFTDGTKVDGDLLLGCDGIHSFIRMNVVQPDRKPVYSGLAVAYGLLDAAGVSARLQFDETAVHSGRFGTFLTSYCDAEKSRLYVGAVMETADVGSREGWAVRGENQEALRKELVRRFGGSSMPYLEDVVEKVDSFTLFPVYKLPTGGVWRSGRIMLLGDAAHAMPPQGESVGLALEDVVLLSRLAGQHETKSTAQILADYESLRKPRIAEAFKEAEFRWETAKDRGWLMAVLMEWMTWFFLKWMAKSKERDFAFDVRDIEVP
ncbi:FAD/NAD(P)-binding domain-containing protein [Lepidopterella palustris CBS 459.81]|uniref:FAD/NAD(P)-binding domain-containing protein n=1 Tax=Lepidopterella palustris CBS 459.81 TaxID=1314670 RepID=A0A8E2EJK5_9PEZI|nr:FAD/NAD(P)-binding domain-containing protein [Lepidopterella palustris CBS 459.81]